MERDFHKMHGFSLGRGIGSGITYENGPNLITKMSKKRLEQVRADKPASLASEKNDLHPIFQSVCDLRYLTSNRSQKMSE